MKVSNITCAVVLIGTELTEGKIRDSNGAFIASEMKRRSIPVREIVSVPDDQDIIIHTLRRLREQNSIVCISGGLGPTSDDITRDAVAAAFGKQLESRDECIRHLKDRGIEHAWKENLRQTLIPEGFGVLPNPLGTACGFWGDGGALIISMPGPPRELQAMFTGPAAELLSERFSLDSPPELCFSLFLVSESVLEETLTGAGMPSVSWSTRVEEHRIVVTLRGKREGDLRRVYGAVEASFGSCRIAPEEIQAAGLFSRELRRRGKRVVCAESCTGGLAAKLLTEEPGSSNVFWGSLVTYREGAKSALLGIDGRLLEKEGSVSEAVVSRMCTGALRVSDADIAVAITGNAGPPMPEDRQPAGTVWVGAQLRGKDPQTRLFSFSGGRDRVRRQAAVAAILFGKAVFDGKERLDSNKNWGYS